MSHYVIQTKGKKNKEIKVTEPISSCVGEVCCKPKPEIVIDNSNLPSIDSVNITIPDFAGTIPDFSEMSRSLSRHLSRHDDLLDMSGMLGASWHTSPGTIIGHVSSWGSIGMGNKSTLPDMDIKTVRATNKAMQEKMGAKYVHFEDKTGSWNSLIEKSFRDGTFIDGLNQSKGCIMGTSWDNNNDWYTTGGCDDCRWLGLDGLSKFSSFGSMNPVDSLGKEHIVANNKKGFKEYKDLWEYHWNEKHVK